jgi:predicted N-formylglutamate amidohydrolase
MTRRSAVTSVRDTQVAKDWENPMDEAPPARVPEPAVAIERAEASSPLVLVCDHASNHLPARYGSLGLRAGDLLKHFAWDPGALALSRRLSALLDAPLVFGCVSRLALDVNRQPSDFDLIVETADGASVPGNSGLSAAERERRVAEIYTPYHAAVEDLLAKRAQRGQRSALIAIHTYTPNLQGVVRPWHCGVIFASDARLGEALVKGLRKEDELVVGVNEPYAPSDRVYHTMAWHGEANGNPAVMIEVRNDLVANADGQRAWAMRLAPLLQSAVGKSLNAGGAEPRKWTGTA